MTCRYREMNPLEALYEKARQYPSESSSGVERSGVDAIAHRMEKNPAVLYSKLRPSVLTHHVSVTEFSEILQHLNDAGVPDWNLPLQALNWRHGHCAFQLPTIGDCSNEQLTSLVCNTMKEIGDVAGRVGQAMSDGVITMQELDSIEKEFMEAQAALAMLREAVKAQHAATEGGVFNLAKRPVVYTPGK